MQIEDTSLTLYTRTSVAYSLECSLYISKSTGEEIVDWASSRKTTSAPHSVNLTLCASPKLQFNNERDPLSISFHHLDF